MRTGLVREAGFPDWTCGRALGTMDGCRGVRMPTGRTSRSLCVRDLTNMDRRRSHLEMLACALLVAVLAVQPAGGDSKRKAQGPPGAAATAAPAAAKGKARFTHAAKGAPAPDNGAAAGNGPGAGPGKGPGAGPGKGPGAGPGKGPGAGPSKGAGAAPGNGPPSHAQPGADAPGPPPADVVPSAPPEEGDPGTAPPMPSAPAEQPVPPPAADPGAAARGPGAAPESARGATGDSATGPSAQPNTDPRPSAGSTPPATSGPAPQPNTEEPSSGRVAIPDATRGTTRRRRGGGATRNRPGARARPPAQASPASGPFPLTRRGAAIPASAIEVPLVTQATEAITRVRSAGPGETSAPRPRAGDTVPPLQGVASVGASDSSVGEVLVSWAKYALAVLALLVLALGINSILAAGRTRRLERQRARLMEDIGLLQAALLPAVPSRLGALLTTVAYRPADGPAAGGDFYDAFALPDGRVGLLLGDVSGHGRQALAKTTLVRFTVRAHLEAGLSPREAIAIAGRTLDGRLSDDFATVIAAIHDPAKGTLTYASAGHPPPIVIGPSRHRPLTASSAPPIGVGFPTGQRQTVLPMPEGVSVMIYSDGLLEARMDGVPLGPEPLAAWLAELGPEATAKALLDRVVTRADRVPDDLAAILLHASPGATAPAARLEQLKLDVLDMDGPDLDGFLTAAGVSEVDRLIAGRRVSELLATTSGVIVEVRMGEHPMVSVAAIGDEAGLSTRPSARTR